jgi:hypothetical protein
MTQNELYAKALELVRDCYKEIINPPTEEQMRQAADKIMKAVSAIYHRPEQRHERDRHYDSKGYCDNPRRGY